MDDNEGVPRNTSGKLGLVGAAVALVLLIAALRQLSAQGVAWGKLAIALTFWFGLTATLFVAARRVRRADCASRQDSE